MEPRLLSFLLGALGIAFGAGGATAMFRARLTSLERAKDQIEKDLESRQTIVRCREEHEHVELGFSELKQQNRELLQMMGDLGTTISEQIGKLHSRVDDLFKSMAER